MKNLTQILILLSLFLIETAQGESYPQSLGSKKVGAGTSNTEENAKLYPGAGLPPLPDSQTIRGKCVVVTSSPSTIDVPCPSIPVALLGQDGKEISRAMVTEGNFRFPTTKGLRYFVSIVSQKFELTSPRVGPIQSGDEVILHVRKISRK